MPVTSMEQVKTKRYVKFEALLIHLKSMVDWNQKDISRRLGYPSDVISRVKTEKDYVPTPQLIAALELLCELVELKLHPKPKPLEEQIQELREQIHELRTGNYPGHKPSPPVLDEGERPANSLPLSKAEQTAAGAAASARQLAQESGPKRKAGAPSADKHDPASGAAGHSK